jgi:hypothetical protein
MDSYRLTRLALETVAPLVRATSDPAAEAALLREVGFALPDGMSLLSGIGQATSRIVSAAVALAVVDTDDSEAWATALGKLVEAVWAAVEAFQQFADTLSAAARGSPFVSETKVLEVLVARLTDHLLTSLLRRRTPAVYELLVITGIVEETEESPPAGSPYEVAFTRRAVRWERVPEVISNPFGAVGDRYHWSDPTAPVQADLIIRDLRALAPGLRLRAELQPIDQRAKAGFDLALSGAAVPEDPETVVARIPLLPLPESPLGLEIYPIADQAGKPDGVGVGVYVEPNVHAHPARHRRGRRRVCAPGDGGAPFDVDSAGGGAAPP